jgi:hypothetical protein
VGEGKDYAQVAMIHNVKNRGGAPAKLEIEPADRNPEERNPGETNPERKNPGDEKSGRGSGNPRNSHTSG